MSLLDRVRKIKSRPFMEAVAAATAVVACADGLVNPEEIDKLVEYIRLDESLSVFDAGEVIETFDQFIERFSFDPNIGKIHAMQTIQCLRRRSEEARLLILISCAIGQADHEFDNNERLAIREIARALGFDPKEFNLDLKAPSLADLPRHRQPPTKPSTGPEWMRKSPPPPPPIKPSPPKPEKKADDIPDWMTRSPKPSAPPPPEPDIPEWMKHVRVSKQENMPDWMRHPPQAPSSAEKQADIPEWMRNAPRPTTRKEMNIPDWMRHPPKPESSESAGKSDPQKEKTAIPDWMKTDRNPEDKQG